MSKRCYRYKILYRDETNRYLRSDGIVFASSHSQAVFELNRLYDNIDTVTITQVENDYPVYELSTTKPYYEGSKA